MKIYFKKGEESEKFTTYIIYLIQIASGIKWNSNLNLKHNLYLFNCQKV